MKRTAKLIGAAAAVVLALVFVTGCENVSTDDPDADGDLSAKIPLTDTFQTYYLDISAAGLAGLEGFHLKNLSANPAGIQIERIFASDATSPAGSVVVWEFDDPETGSKYWGFDGGTITDGVWSSGEVAAPVAPATETYITGFATAEFAAHAYVGIVAKNLSATVKGDEVMLVPIIGSPNTELQKTFEQFFE